MAEPMKHKEGLRQRSISDIVLALIAIGGGIAVIIYASGMKTLSTGQMGPGLFPALIGWLFVLFGAVLLFQGIRGKVPERDEGEGEVIDEQEALSSDAVLVDESQGGSYAIVDESSGRLLVNGLVVIGGIVVYVLLADTLGFIITLFLVLSGIMLTLREKVWRVVVFAAVVTAVIYLGFEKGLLVQLPNGILGF